MNERRKEIRETFQEIRELAEGQILTMRDIAEMGLHQRFKRMEDNRKHDLFAAAYMAAPLSLV